eukprot:scaffold79419_cov26-Tisochrysis_lutea.AAC.1
MAISEPASGAEAKGAGAEDGHGHGGGDCATPGIVGRAARASSGGSSPRREELCSLARAWLNYEAPASAGEALTGLPALTLENLGILFDSFLRQGPGR